MAGMTPEKFARLQQLFDQAADLPAVEQTAFVERACAGDAELRERLRQLLQNDHTAELLKPVTAGAADGLLNFEGQAIPRRLGPYELLEQIGAGGMGAVYKAGRVDAEYRSTVAIKLMRPGLDAGFVLGRFRRERQTLAKLTHPNIARLLDGGTSENHDGLPGVPYIVMEYISGLAISEYAHAKRLGVRERIALFLPVSHAVDYAHRNFVIHRDIKPGNILVDQDGVPKLLDFGICKLLYEDQLEAGSTLATMTQGIGLMTPDYASPEQARGEAVSPSSDVYALGLVLYELLTGRQAQQIEKYTPLGIQEAVCLKEVELPSKAAIPAQLSAALRGDLDNILMKALQKEPERRYETAAALAADLERHLRDEPVQARPDTRVYRLKKFVKRNRLAVSAAAAIVLAIAIGGGVAIRQSLAARESERAASAMVRDGLFSVFDSIRQLPGSIAARRQIITTATGYLERLESSNSTDPAVLREVAEGYRRLGDLQGSGVSGANLGEDANSAGSYRRAIRHWDRLLAQRPDSTEALRGKAQVLLTLGELEGRRMGPGKALESTLAGIPAARELLHRLPADLPAKRLLADLLTLTGIRQRDLKQFASSEAFSKEGLALYRQLAAATPEDSDVLAALGSAEAAVGMTVARIGRLEEALGHHQRGVEHNLRAVALDPRHVNNRRSLVLAYSHVGDVLGNPLVPNMGLPGQAVEPYERMVAIAEKLRDDDPLDARASTDVAFAQYRLAAVLPDTRAAARRNLLESSRIVLQQRLAGAPGNLVLLANLANIESYLGDHHHASRARKLAMEHYQRAVQIAEENAAGGSPYMPLIIVRSGIQLALLQAEAGQGAAALRLLERAEAVARREAQSMAGAPLSGEDIVRGRSLLPRVYLAYSLAQTAAGNRHGAQQWRQKAEAAQRELTAMPGYTPLIRSEWDALARSGLSGGASRAE